MAFTAEAFLHKESDLNAVRVSECNPVIAEEHARSTNSPRTLAPQTFPREEAAVDGLMSIESVAPGVLSNLKGGAAVHHPFAVPTRTLLEHELDAKVHEQEANWDEAGVSVIASLQDSVHTEAKNEQEEAKKVAPGDLFRDSVRQVTVALGVTKQFRTLRDHTSVDIHRKELQHVRIIGEGAFAVVEQCLYLPANRMVAVKRLKPKLIKNTDDVKGMLKEITLMRKLRNQHIIEYIGCGSWDNSTPTMAKLSMFLVEELVDGGTMKQMVSKQMRSIKPVYRLRDAVRWLLQVAQGLKYLHQCQPKVIHRDLKLENLLLDVKDPHVAEAKIADFGLSALVVNNAQDDIPRDPLPRTGRRTRRSSALLEGDWTSAAKRRTSNLVSEAPKLPPGGTQQLAGHLSIAGETDQLSGRTGTLMYMAPEVYRQELYNEKADVFSFAMICYELCHNYMMISATDGSFQECQAYARRVARAGYRPPIDDSLPSPLRTLMASCWHADPSARPSMADVVGQLIKVQNTLDFNRMEKAAGGSCCCIC
mmetsp:Transcript_23068/g.50616  ORF Transcript_23068/g.50616 Transcript_23068/m.50616 type:complete len:535 (+) Transcript_23068:148-1752(+)